MCNESDTDAGPRASSRSIRAMDHASAQVGGLILAITFACSAVAKVVRFRTWRALVPRYGLPAGIDAATILGVPIAEGVIPVLFVAGASRAGAAFALVLLAAFSLAVLRARRLEGDRLPCGCFGKATTRDYRVTILRNALLALAAALVLLAGRDVMLFEGLGAPSGSEVVAVPLVIIGAATIGWLLWSVLAASRRGRS